MALGRPSLHIYFRPLGVSVMSDVRMEYLRYKRRLIPNESPSTGPLTCPKVCHLPYLTECVSQDGPK